MLAVINYERHNNPNANIDFWRQETSDKTTWTKV